VITTLKTWLEATETAKQLYGLLEAGSFATVLAEIESHAAAEAFSRIATAFDKRGQTYVCIGHVDTVISACRYSIHNMSFLDKTLMTRRADFFFIRQTLILHLCLRSVCYAYVGEQQMCNDDLNDAIDVNYGRKMKEGEGLSVKAWDLSASFMNPLAWADMLYYGVFKNRPFWYVDDQSLFKLKHILFKRTV